MQVTFNGSPEDIKREMLDYLSMAGISVSVTNDDRQVCALKRAGRVIDAIKLYRQIHNVGLKEAKDAVDEMV